MRENRQNVRFRSDEVLDCYCRDEQFEAEILDVSWGGIRIGCLQDLPLGRSVFIQHREGSRTQFPVMTAVRWKSRGVVNEFGLEFQEGAGTITDQWVRELFPEESATRSQSGQKRGEVRAGVTLPIATEEGFLEGETLDLSASGARFRMEHKLPAETSLLLCLPSSLLQLQAQVLRAEKEGEQWIHRVRFEDGDAENKELLSSFVAGVVG